MNATFHASVRRGRKPFARFTLKTPNGTRMVVTVARADGDQDGLKEGLDLVYGAITEAQGEDAARAVFKGLLVKLEDHGT